MTLKEGRCPNCGSLLQLDAQAEKGHCLFCDAVFANAESFRIAENPAGMTFPNLPQPKYEGPNLDPRPAANVPIPKFNEPAKKKAVAQPAQPVYVPKETVKMPDIRVPMKMKLQITALIVAVVAIVGAISVPMILSRNASRAQLMAAMTEVAPFTLNVSESVVIHGLDNSRLLIAADAAVSQADAVTLFQNYCEKRVAVEAITSQDFADVYGGVSVRLVSPAGGWQISKPASQAALADGSAVQVLP